jgi:DMSO/TMAO reductase YedYZ molybdopterin-dependent catalytic subunit
VAALPFGHALWAATEASAQGAAGAAGPTTLPSGLIVRESNPVNLEFPFSRLEGFITPTSQFYVRSHFATPKLDRAAWRLRVEGAVERPLELSYEELLRMQSETRPVTLECAGNGRSFLNPPVRGVQWAEGAVSNAEWTGVPLAAVLRRAKVKRGAVEVVLEGADTTELKSVPRPAGPIHFARSLPLAKALDPSVLLAHQMNGAELPVDHGFPVRGVVPGWYGVSSIKWLTRIVVTEQPFNGHFQTVDYAYYERRNGLPSRVPLTTMQVKSEIARPAAGESVPAGAPYRVFGAAWTGDDADIRKVEVSTDGGRSWSEGKLLGKSARGAWRLWEYDWRTPSAGKQTLLARATDSRGRTQPMERDPDRDNYMITHVLPVQVTVR